jgi:hypothetical protein
LLIKLIDYNNPKAFASGLRKKRSWRITNLVEQIYNEFGSVRILDLGGTYIYWNIFHLDWFERFNVTITLLNLSTIPLPAGSNPRFESVAGNACDLGRYQDDVFHLVHSNSVIEHVGSWSAMALMASESNRVGRAYYHQTPYFWFPIEPHFLFPILHWLPMPMRVKLALRLRLGTWPRATSIEEAVAAQSSAVLLDKSMMISLFPHGEMELERFWGLQKSLIVIKRI